MRMIEAATSAPQTHTDRLHHQSGKPNVSTAFPNGMEPEKNTSIVYERMSAIPEMATMLRTEARRSTPPTLVRTAPMVARFVAGAVNKNACAVPCDAPLFSRVAANETTPCSHN